MNFIWVQNYSQNYSNVDSLITNADKDSLRSTRIREPGIRESTQPILTGLGTWLEFSFVYIILTK